MSTADLFISDEDVKEFIEETKIAPQYVYGNEDEEFGVCPFITFYVYHKQDDYLPLAQKAIDIYHKLQTIMDKPFLKELKNATEVWFKIGDKRLPTDHLAEAKKSLDKLEQFYLQATDMEGPTASARWAFSADITNNSSMCYSTVKITFRHSWYLQNQATWHDFVLDCLKTLEPEQCYSGFEIGTTTSGFGPAYEGNVMERICADYFYGLDIDHPIKMGYQFNDDEDGYVDITTLGAGIRTPTWCFLLSPIWRNKLNMDETQIRAALNHPNITITSILRSDGDVNLWIQLGELSLYPVEDGVPELPVLAAKLIKPIRCDDLELISLDPWDDDPNPRFDMISSPQWMARFDPDSEWPTRELRKNPNAPHNPPVPPRHSVQGNQPCPESGYYITPAKIDARRFFKKGEIMPEYGNDVWQTFWQWDVEQED